MTTQTLLPMLDAPTRKQPSRYALCRQNAAAMERASVEDLKHNYGVKVYVIAKRCPKCGLKSYRRVPETGLCMGCVVARRAANRRART